MISYLIVPIFFIEVKAVSQKSKFNPDFILGASSEGRIDLIKNENLNFSKGQHRAIHNSKIESESGTPHYHAKPIAIDNPNFFFFFYSFSSFCAIIALSLFSEFSFFGLSNSKFLFRQAPACCARL